MSKALRRVEKILASLDDIGYIIENHDLPLTAAIEDKIIKPALRMHIVRIAEQFSKLKEENEFKILEHFDPTDLRGIAAVRNYIAHDYDSVDDGIIEDVIRKNLPRMRTSVLDVIKSVK